MNRKAIRNIVLLWLAWSIILIGYMQIANMRYAPFRPDESLSWTSNETTIRSNQDKPYLLDPFLNTQVAWDSEFYLSIATLGYDDPDIRVVTARNGPSDEGYSMSYAFFPLYPYMMKVVRLPFTALDITPIAASTIAGVLVSLLGTLAGMIALYDIVREELGDTGGIRTGFMMIIFPTAVFFTVVYTDALFVGLAFSSLALMRRKHLVLAAIIAALATWTRAVGGTLIVPLLVSWWLLYYRGDDKRLAWSRLPFVFLPVLAYLLWRLAFGVPFDFVQENWFGNNLFQFEATLNAWRQILERAATVPETSVVVAMGIGSIILAFLSCLLNLRRYPALALFGIVALLVPLAGATGTQSTFRYVLAIPTLWIMLGQWSRYIVFDRAWTLLSILLLAMQAYLFTFDFWVA